MFPRAVRIARLRGIDVRVDPTWLLIAVLVLWSFGSRFGDDRSLPVAAAMAVGGAVGFFGSILAHELAHAFEARHRELTVAGITLFAFGGVTEMDAHTRRPRDEFTVAAIGPWTSVVLAAALGLVTAGIDTGLPGRAGWGAVSDVTGTLAWINLGLAVFNLVPGAPLDGGRVLRAFLWASLGDRYRAATWSARVGQGVAVTLFLLGTWLLANEPGALLPAAWSWVLAAFLFIAAWREVRHARMQRALEGRTAGVLGPDPAPRVPHDTPLSSTLPWFTGDRTVVIVVDGSGTATGVLSRGQVESLAAPDRDVRVAADLMTSITEVPSVAVDAPILDAVAHLHDGQLVAMTRDGVIVAVVDRVTANRVLVDLESGRGAADDPVRAP